MAHRYIAGSHQWMSRNEEKAWEEWEAEALLQVASMAASLDGLRTAIRERKGRDIRELLQANDAAAEQLDKMRDGPTPPED